jgi:hypothetical protein
MGECFAEIRSLIDTTGKCPFEEYHADIRNVGIEPMYLLNETSISQRARDIQVSEECIRFVNERLDNFREIVARGSTENRREEKK